MPKKKDREESKERNPEKITKMPFNVSNSTSVTLVWNDDNSANPHQFIFRQIYVQDAATEPLIVKTA